MNNFYVYNLNDDLPTLQPKRYSNLQTIELKNQVIAAHETYLQLDDNDQRDDFRKKLHKYIVNYLLKVPHSSKFLLPEFNLIFENCVENNAQFDPLRAAESFDVLFKIANNLILKPWRKEFHQICIYNANFVHLISQQIPNYDHILKLMGYELKSKNGVLNYYLINKRYNPEVLKLISFDCYVAYVELRYIYQFGEILASKNIKPNNWHYIYRLRKRYTGDFESTLENYLLLYHDQINEQQAQINRKYKHLSNLISQYEQHQQADCLVDKQQTTNGNLIDLDHSLPNNKYDSIEQLLLNSSSSSELNNKYQPTASYNHQPIHQNQTGFLQNSGYLQNSGGSGDNYYLTKHNLTNNFNNHHHHSAHHQQAPSETNLDQVDFIDDGEEEDDDVDGLTVNLKNVFNSKIKELDNNAQKLEKAMKSDADKLTNSSNTGLINGKIKSNSLEKKSSKASSRSVEKKYSTLDLKSDKKKQASSQQKRGWCCSHCTFLNDPKDCICKICSKSMTSKTDSDRLTLAGRECSLCTLVNKRNEITCRACGNSLKNSASYF